MGATISKIIIQPVHAKLHMARFTNSYRVVFPLGQVFSLIVKRQVYGGREARKGEEWEGKIQVAEFTFELTSTLLIAKIINLFH